ncbi:hypothetical protein GQ464_010985 [Rhodocaloribacter litoris]|uniref:hypothetical protein n=1 Tax=Rhodocaloribacter litoris TaxID=2558931 RepID=UPI00141E3C38|nr:hypothetical protein [Rhodocaloribacter litoris]QXD13983.1 hypothetical protein GQ464_010985 [Rhodocaloribacter litoris]
MSALTLQGTGLSGYQTSAGVSEEALELQDCFAGVLDSLFRNVTLGEPLEKAQESLEEIFEDCSVENWDGYGAAAVSLDSYLEARRFLGLLPMTFPMPDVTVEPEGVIAFEWYNGPKRVFAVGIGRDGLLTYAGLFGINKTHGTEYFGDEIPETILNNLRRLFANS